MSSWADDPCDDAACEGCGSDECEPVQTDRGRWIWLCPTCCRIRCAQEANRRFWRRYAERAGAAQ